MYRLMRTTAEVGTGEEAPVYDHWWRRLVVAIRKSWTLGAGRMRDWSEKM